MSRAQAGSSLEAILAELAGADIVTASPSAPLSDYLGGISLAIQPAPAANPTPRTKPKDGTTPREAGASRGTTPRDAKVPSKGTTPRAGAPAGSAAGGTAQAEGPPSPAEVRRAVSATCILPLVATPAARARCADSACMHAQNWV